MQTLHQLLIRFKDDFAHSRKGEERSQWFIYTILAIIFPFASSKTSNLLRCLKTIFGFSYITKRRFYTFMASSKIPWAKLWKTIREAIPAAVTQKRLLVALDDYLNPKSGKKIFGCHRFFDHAAKQNQSKYPWAQNIVSAGLLAKIKGRWACLPLSARFYHPKKDTEKGNIRVGKDKVTFQTKLEQAAQMIIELYHAYNIPVLVVADSWFGNNGLWGPVHKQLGPCFHLISRLRCSNNLFDLPENRKEKKRGRPKKYGSLLGNVSELAVQYQNQTQSYHVDLYGRIREVLAFDRVFMLKTLKCPVRVVWVYRKTQWVALFSTDLSLSVQQLIEYYGARWKIESGFKELKQDIGSLETQTRDPHAVINHLNFCMMAISLVWIHAMHLEKTPKRRHAVTGRSHFAFSDARRHLAGTIISDNFSSICPNKSKIMINSIATSLLRMAA
jgi:SRSO17 transposase